MQKQEPSGLAIYRLIYLGLDGRQARVRLETIHIDGTLRDEFRFALTPTNEAKIFVNGGEFDLIADGPKAQITLRKPMVSDFALPVR